MWLEFRVEVRLPGGKGPQNTFLFTTENAAREFVAAEKAHGSTKKFCLYKISMTSNIMDKVEL